MINAVDNGSIILEFVLEHRHTATVNIKRVSPAVSGGRVL